MNYEPNACDECKLTLIKRYEHNIYKSSPGVYPAKTVQNITKWLKEPNKKLVEEIHEELGDAFIWHAYIFTYVIEYNVSLYLIVPYVVGIATIRKST